MSENTKKRFQMPSSYTVLIIIIAIMAILTWIIPAGKYDTDEAGNLIAGTYQTVTSNPTRDLRCFNGSDSGYARSRTYKSRY